MKKYVAVKVATDEIPFEETECMGYDYSCKVVGIYDSYAEAKEALDREWNADYRAPNPRCPAVDEEASRFDCFPSDVVVGELRWKCDKNVAYYYEIHETEMK